MFEYRLKSGKSRNQTRFTCVMVFSVAFRAGNRSAVLLVLYTVRYVITVGREDVALYIDVETNANDAKCTKKGVGPQTNSY